MAGVNKTIILGNLGRDPEMSYTPGGMAICKFSLATSKKKKDGEEITSWHRCTSFNKTAELIGQYVTKGQQLYVEGELSYGEYEKDGVKRYTTDIIVNQFTFIGSKGGDNQGGGGGHGGYNPNSQQGGQGGGYQQQGQNQASQQGGYNQQGQNQQQGSYQQQGQGQGGYQEQGGGYQSCGQGGNQGQQGGYQQPTAQGGGNGENYPQPPEDSIPF